MKYPIFIPSKGRAGSQYSFKMLTGYGLKPLVVIEKDDLEAYSEHVPSEQLLVLPERNKGFAFACNWIRNYAVKVAGTPFYWHFDDDVMYLVKRVNDKKSRCCLTEATDRMMDMEREVSGYTNVDLAALRSEVFMWSIKPERSFNVLGSSAMLIRSDVQYIWNPRVQADCDYILQICMAGRCTMIFNRFGYVKQPDRVAREGCLSEALGGMNAYLGRRRMLVSKYPDFYSVRWNENHTDMRLVPNQSIWKRFTQKPIPCTDDN